jgi:hypothetical protein
VKWVLLAIVTVLVLGPGLFSLQRGRQGADGSRPWLGRTAAFAVAALWVLAVIALLRAL